VIVPDRLLTADDAFDTVLPDLVGTSEARRGRDDPPIAPAPVN
jgi:hypothetical protein